MRSRYRIVILMFLLVCQTFIVGAQDLSIESQKLYCVDHSQTALSFPGDTLALKHFYEKVDTLLFEGKGHVNILQIGGSHIQAGVFSNRMRSHFMNFQPGITAGQGLIFPYKVAKTNGPPNYAVKYKGEWSRSRCVSSEFEACLGMCGIAVSTSDTTAEISVFTNRDNTYDSKFNKLTLLGYENYGGFEPCVFAASEETDSYGKQVGAIDSTAANPTLNVDSISEKQPIFGHYDSLSQSWSFDIDDSADYFVLRFVRSDTSSHLFRFTLTGLILENDNNGITYHSIGVNGASVKSYLKCENFERDMQLLKPDLVIFGIGINDATAHDFSKKTFMCQYDSLITQIKNISPNCDFIFLTNNDSYKKTGRRQMEPNKNGLIAQEAFYEMACNYNSAIWDIFSLMGGLGSSSQWEFCNLMKSDMVHFTEAGYKLLGDMLFDSIAADYCKHIQQLETKDKVLLWNR